MSYYYFWKTKSPFSNWYPATYTLDGIEFNCSEQGVMWAKAKLFGDETVAEQILNCNPNQQKKMKDLGRKVSNFDQKKWDEHKVNIYKNHNRAKYTQNNTLKHFLLSTGNKTLVEASPYDRIWGIGLTEENAKKRNPNTWPGQNLLGKLLTEIKNELK